VAERANDGSWVIHFGVFEADLRAGELRRNGAKVKLQEQPFQILAMLLERPGEIVTREEVRARLWSADTFVDFDHGLNSAIRRLRDALGDSAENPSFVETLGRRGYRFIAPVASRVLRERQHEPIIVRVTGGAPSADQLAEELPPAKPKTRGRPRYYGLVMLGAVIVTVGALAVWKTVLRTPSVPKVVRFTALTNDGQAKIGPMATDGSRIYFNEVLLGPRNLLVQVSIKGGEAVPLSVPLKQPGLLDLSREGTELLVANDEGIGLPSLWVQPAAGGSPRRVGSVLADDARFGADGTSIIYGNGHDVYSVSRDGSSPRKLLTVDGDRPYSFQFSPDVRTFRFSASDTQIDSMAIMEAAADGTGLHKMFPGCLGKWTSDGRFFIFENRRDGRLDLWALPEARSFPWRKRDDRPIQLTAGPLNFEDPLPSKDGKEVFAIGGSHRAEVIRYDSRSGQFVPYLSGISAEGLAFSRDGQWVTYASYPDGTLWRSKVDGSERRQLTFPPLRVLLPRWSPDGQRIAFNALLPGVAMNVYLVSSEGGTPQRILPSEQSQVDANWSPDGNSLVFGTLRGHLPVSTTLPIYTIDLRSKRVSTLPGSSGLYSPRWSPDGRYIVAITTEHPFKLMLFDFATQKWTEAFGFEMGYPSWSRDGKYIYFQDRHNQDERIVRFRLSDRKIENIVDLKDVGRLTTGTIVPWFGLAPDDSPLFARDISTQEIYALEMDWP
jgi:Tol biopolymer transport system component/DNA-binding winged helix-turn-helix (wHTH) protein